MSSHKVRIGVYGPTKSGKTSFIERITFPEGEYKEPYPGNVTTIPITTETEDFILTEYPDGYLPSENDKIDRVVILVNRSEEKWRPYLNEALRVSECVYPVYSLIDSRNYNPKIVMKDAYKVSSKKGDGIQGLYTHLLKGTKRTTRNRNKKKVSNEEGWVSMTGGTKETNVVKNKRLEIASNPFDVLG